MDRVRDVLFGPGDGLVVDEVCMAAMEIDDVEAWLDLKKGRDVACRHKDGSIPKGTPRIFSTNYVWERFWPRGASSEDRSTPIKRRILWVNVRKDLRKPTPSKPGTPSWPNDGQVAFAQPPGDDDLPQVLPCLEDNEELDPWHLGFDN